MSAIVRQVPWAWASGWTWADIRGQETWHEGQRCGLEPPPVAPRQGLRPGEGGRSWLTPPDQATIGCMVDYSEIISLAPDTRGGKPCIRGLRITVQDVLEYLAGGMTPEEIVADFPT